DAVDAGFSFERRAKTPALKPKPRLSALRPGFRWTLASNRGEVVRPANTDTPRPISPPSCMPPHRPDPSCATATRPTSADSHHRSSRHVRRASAEDHRVASDDELSPVATHDVSAASPPPGSESNITCRTNLADLSACDQVVPLPIRVVTSMWRHAYESPYCGEDPGPANATRKGPGSATSRPNDGAGS